MNIHPTNVSCLKVLWFRTLQIVTNLLIMFSMVGIGYLIWIYLELEDSMRSSIVTAILISKIIWFLPIIFAVIVK